MRKGQKHTEDSKRKCSANRKGKCAGHPFWGVKTLSDETKAKLKAACAARRKMYEARICANPDCKKIFSVFPKNLKKKFCSKPCANKYIGSTSLIGKINLGRTPAEGSGKCKWYQFASKQNGIVKVQGTWELRLVNCLDVQGKSWRTNHNKDRFTYIDEENIVRTYCPDFFCEGEYLEVKGYMDQKATHKMNEILKQGVPVKIIKWSDLKKIEEKLFGKSLSGVNTIPAVINKLTA
jgi:hypothetical protein